MIRNNIIHRDASSPTGDVGISVNYARDYAIHHNTVILNGSFDWTIEYRHQVTDGVIAHNLTVDYLRRNKDKPTVSLEEQAGRIQLEAKEEIDTAALRQDVQAAIGQLAEDQQQVLILRFFHGLSHDEVALIMGRQPGATRALQSRALQSLQRVMGTTPGG